METKAAMKISPRGIGAASGDFDAPLGDIEVKIEGDGDGVDQRVQVLGKLNKFGIGATPGPFVKTLLGKHAVDKSYEKFAIEENEDGENRPMLTDEDYRQRLSRVQGFDKSCQDVFEQAINGNVRGDLTTMIILPGEKELASIPVVAMMGGPFEDGETEILGQGAVILTESADKKHRLIFSMLADSREIQAKEQWSLSDQKGTKRVAGDGEYLVARGQDRFLGFFNVEGGLFDVQVKAHDEAILKALFSASQTSSKEKQPCCDCFQGCVGCLKGCPIFKDCPIFKCCSCFKGCACARDPDVALAGSWSFSAEFSANLKDLIEAKIQTITNNASYKFPDCPSLTNPEDRAVLVEFTRCVKLQYRNSSTNKIQQCTLVVQPQVPYATIAAFASMVSVYTIRGEPGEEKIAQRPQMQALPMFGSNHTINSGLPCCKKKRRTHGGKSSQMATKSWNTKRCWFIVLAVVAVILLIGVISAASGDKKKCWTTSNHWNRKCQKGACPGHGSCDE